MKIIFLGTNGWYDTRTGNTVSILIRTKGLNVVLDGGNGIAKLDRYIQNQEEKPLYLFLSHYHLDHIEGLHTLTKFHFSKGMTLCIPSGTKDVLHTFINRPFTLPLDKLPYPTTVRELPGEEKALPFSVTALPLHHADLTMGYRMEIEGKVVVYCPDTGYCKNAVTLAHQADLLIAECAYKSGQSNENWPHLNPESAARIAKEAGAKRLALVHFDAVTHPDLADRYDSETAARKVFAETVATFDEIQIDL